MGFVIGTSYGCSTEHRAGVARALGESYVRRVCYSNCPKHTTLEVQYSVTPQCASSQPLDGPTWRELGD